MPSVRNPSSVRHGRKEMPDPVKWVHFLVLLCFIVVSGCHAAPMAAAPYSESGGSVDELASTTTEVIESEQTCRNAFLEKNPCTVHCSRMVYVTGACTRVGHSTPEVFNFVAWLQGTTLNYDCSDVQGTAAAQLILKALDKTRDDKCIRNLEIEPGLDACMDRDALANAVRCTWARNTESCYFFDATGTFIKEAPAPTWDTTKLLVQPLFAVE